MGEGSLYQEVCARFSQWQCFEGDGEGKRTSSANSICGQAVLLTSGRVRWMGEGCAETKQVRREEDYGAVDRVK